jgi:hypothetical protein
MFVCSLILSKFGGKENRKRPDINLRNSCGKFSGFNLTHFHSPETENSQQSKVKASKEFS